MNVILGAYIWRKKKSFYSGALSAGFSYNYSYQVIWLPAYFGSHCVYTLCLRNIKYLYSLLYIYSEYMWNRIFSMWNILKSILGISLSLKFHKDCYKVWNHRNIQLKFKINFNSFILYLYILIVLYYYYIKICHSW